MRITVACPESLIEKANHLAMYLGYSEKDSLTYGEPEWVDSNNNTYSVASFEASDDWIFGVTMGNDRPEWDKNSLINMEFVSDAKECLIIWLYESSTFDPPMVSKDSILAYANINPKEAVSMMGLTKYTVQE